MRLQLDAPTYTFVEVHRALLGMAPWKAPRPDGFHAGFYQENWSMLGTDISSLCLRILNGENSIGELNKTLLVLIPKIKNPSCPAQYIPISLCNVL